MKREKGIGLLFEKFFFILIFVLCAYIFYLLGGTFLINIFLMSFVSSLITIYILQNISKKKKKK